MLATLQGDGPRHGAIHACAYGIAIRIEMTKVRCADTSLETVLGSGVAPKALMFLFRQEIECTVRGGSHNATSLQSNTACSPPDWRAI